jgi:hypothetical protein
MTPAKRQILFGVRWKGPQIWRTTAEGLVGSATVVSPGVYRILSSDGTFSSVVGPAATLTVGKWYEVKLNVDSVATAGTGLRVANAGPIILAVTGPQSFIFQADQTVPEIKRNGGVTDIIISGVSFREVNPQHGTT